MEDVAVIGGGLAGLTTALALAKKGLRITVIEKKKYPFHRVCGEYVSNEVLPFLESLDVSVSELNPTRINRFQLSSPSGRMLEAPLSLGGFGLSRFAFDDHLFQLARKLGVSFLQKTAVEAVGFKGEKFSLELSDGQQLESRVCIGAFGKRSSLDRHLDRSFFKARSPYLAVKYHLRTALPKDVIALHNFDNGYAGISAVEDDRYCFCYLTTRENLKRSGTIAKMEEKVLSQNPFLRKIFSESEFLYSQPEVINEISFAPKTAIINHILCCGDAAGLITPLCGNGMALALHSSKIASEAVLNYFNNHQSQVLLEKEYTAAWNKLFARRLQVGRGLQRVFGHKILSEITVATLQKMPAAMQFLIRQTHGKPF